MKFKDISKDEATELYNKHFLNKACSNCDFLRMSVLSNLSMSLNGINEIIEFYESKKELDQKNIYFNIVCIYGFKVSGPLLGSILFTSFSIESFIRICAETVFSEKNTEGKEWRENISEFDNKPSMERVKELSKILQIDPPDEETQKKLEFLMLFRNDVCHDAPVWNSQAGKQMKVKKFKKGAPVIVNENYYGCQYPVLTNDSMPINLRHAINAIDAHDGYVSFILDNTGSDFKKDLSELFLTGLDIQLLRDQSQKLWKQIEIVNRKWNDKIIPFYKDYAMDLNVREIDDFF